MNYTNSQLTAYCGIYCGDCIRFKCRASDLSDSLLDELQRNHFLEYAEVKKHHTKEFEQFNNIFPLLKAISQIRCEIPCGAGGDGCAGSCQIISCVKTRNIDGCWECPDYDKCEKLEFLLPFHGDSIKKNLRLIAKYGIDEWVTFRDKCYPWL